MKKIIITADDLGIDKDTNKAIKECYDFGVLTTSCLMPNGIGFEDAIENVIQTSPKLQIGIHLDIIEGKSLTNNRSLTDKNNNFNNSYIKMLLKSNNKTFLKAIEGEFTAQIEKFLSAGITPAYINTHVHTHSIPAIFNILCKLANKYSIKNVRTQSEIPYYTKGIARHLSTHYVLNIVKNILLNTFTFINLKTLKKYGLKTNKYFIGVLYTGQMDEDTIIAGINKLPDDCVAEIILHPSVNSKKIRHFKEYMALTSVKLKQFFKHENVENIAWEF